MNDSKRKHAARLSGSHDVMNAHRRESFFIVYVIAFVSVAVAAVAVWYYWTSKQTHLASDAQARNAQLEAGPLVQTAVSARGPTVRKVSLVGEALPYRTATLYSKVSGYLAKIAVDTGDHVKAGQFIAEIHSPELDSDYRSAVSTLENRQQIAARTRDLASKGFFSQQSLDNALTDVHVAEANVNQIRTLITYRTIKAPFDGVVTARHVDPGALVTNASTNQTSSQPVVTVADLSRLKVTVYVEQADAPYIRVGGEVEVADAASPDRKAIAKVSRISGELDPHTRTLLTEVDMDNAGKVLMPGSFVNVNVLLAATSYVEVPTTALVTRDKKPYVAAVNGDGTIRLLPIVSAGTDGKVIKISAGLDEGIRVALNLPGSVTDGGRVNAAPPPVAATPVAPPASVVKPPTQTK
jgi:RND family efflux transporter MFP subunit